MSTTAETEITEAEVATGWQQPSRTVLFMARRAEHQMVKKASWPIRDPSTGEVMGNSPGQMIAFRSGAFRCPMDGDVTFADGSTGDAAEVLAWLRGHQSNGNLEEGFWEVPEAPPAPSQDELNWLMQMSVGLDIEGLEQFIEGERGGFNRLQLITAAETSIEQIRAVQAAAEGPAEAA